jgi:hypothetical protein
MPTEVWRPGDYRVCPSCSARHKVQDLRCWRCNTVLAGAPVRHAAPAAVAVTAARASRGLRAVLAIGVVVALAAGLWVRSMFRGAQLEDSVEASSATLPAAPAPDPAWTPPVLSYPPIVGYNQGVPPGMAALAIQAGPPAAADSAPATGMTSIAPPSEPTRKTAFTNDDLVAGRGQDAPVPMAPVASAVLVTAGDAASRAAGANEDAAREWISRVRDREDDLHQAQAKVRRLEVEAEARRAHAAAVAADADAHERAQREVTAALEDLEKAERKVSEKQRDLDEAVTRARAAGVRFER